MESKEKSAEVLVHMLHYFHISTVVVFNLEDVQKHLQNEISKLVTIQQQCI